MDTRDASTTTLAHRRRKLLRVAAGLLVSQEEDAQAHADPARRGGYLLYTPGRVPEIVLDGLAEPQEQAAAERRCLRELALLQQAHEPEAVARSSQSPPPRQAGPGLLGQRLVAAGLIRAEDLRTTLERQKALPRDHKVRRLGSLLVEAGLLTMRQVADALGEQRGVQATSGVSVRVDPALRGLFPHELLAEMEAVPICVVGKTVAVAMVDPLRRQSVERLQALTRYEVRPIVAPQAQVHALLQSLAQAPSQGSPRSGLPGHAGSSASSVPPPPSAWSPRPPSLATPPAAARSAGTRHAAAQAVPAPRGASETPRRGPSEPPKRG